MYVKYLVVREGQLWGKRCKNTPGYGPGEHDIHTAIAKQF